MNTVQETKQQRKEPQAVREETPQYPTWSPPVDIYETKDFYALKADMPGVNKDGLEITLEGTTLVLVGRRYEEAGRNGKPAEQGGIEYRRVFELDPMIETGKVKARIENGVVTVELPKAEKVKPRKIKIGD